MTRFEFKFIDLLALKLDAPFTQRMLIFNEIF